MDKTAELLSISKILENKLDHVANEIFHTYRDKFLIEKITYIVPAVWGVIKDGKLDETQKEIYRTTNKLVEDSISAFSIKDLSDPQAFAIRYLVNRTLIYTISYIIEMTKNQLVHGKISADNMLINLEPSGHA